MNESSHCGSAVAVKERCIRCTQQVLVLGLAALISAQTAELTAAAQSGPAQQAAATRQSQSVSPAQNSGAVQVAAREPSSDELPAAPEPQASQQPQQASGQQQQPAQQQQNAPQQPVGTAAAPYERPTGVPGSRPAGAVIAPAKQKRVRSMVIRVGLLVAGGAAIGAVVGLSRASHSQP